MAIETASIPMNSVVIDYVNVDQRVSRFPKELHSYCQILHGAAAAAGSLGGPSTVFSRPDAKKTRIG